jgi:hypothetical protein
MVVQKSKLVLYIPDKPALDVSLMVDNWREWEVAVERGILDPTYKTTTFPFRFVKEAFTSLKTEFNRYHQNAKGLLYVYISDGIGSFSPIPVIYNLDFMTADVDDNFFSISCRNVDLRTLTKQKGGVEFAMDIADVKDDKNFNYEGVILTNLLEFKRAEMKKLIAAPAAIDYWDNGVFISMGVSFNDSDVHIKDYMEYTDVETQFANSRDNFPTCVKALREVDINIRYLSTALAYSITRVFVLEDARDHWASSLSSATPCFRIYVERTKPDGTVDLAAYKDLPHTTHYLNVSGGRYGACAVSKKDVLNEEIFNYTFNVKEGYGLRVYAMYMRDDFRRAASVSTEMCIAGIGKLNVSYSAKQPPAAYPCITLKGLTERLFLEMGASNVVIDNKTHLSNNDVDVFVAGESLVNTSGGKFYCSYKQLESYLKMTGRCINIKGNTVVIDYINGTDGIFTTSVVPDTVYKGDEVADLRLSPTQELVFSSLEIGYSSMNVTGENRNKEYNVKRTFTTFANSDKSLDLTTSVRGDSIGFAILAAKEKKEFVESKELFVVRVRQEGSRYVANKSYVNGALTSMFNNAVLPERCLRNWLTILGASSDVFMTDDTFFKGSVQGDAATNFPEEVTYFSYANNSNRYIALINNNKYYTKRTFEVIQGTPNVATGRVTCLTPTFMLIEGHEPYSSIRTFTGTDIPSKLIYTYGCNTSPTEVIYRGLSVFNLTQMFGAGNEPDKATCDVIFANHASVYPVGGNVFCNQKITKVLIRPLTLDVATSDDKQLLTLAELPKLIKFEYEGADYHGFIQELRENPLLRQQVEMKLITASLGDVLEYPPQSKANLQHIDVKPFGEVRKVVVDFSGIKVDVVQSMIINGWTTVVVDSLEANRATCTVTFAANTTGSTRTSSIYLRGSNSAGTQHIHHFITLLQTPSQTPDEIVLTPSIVTLRGNDELNESSLQLSYPAAKITPFAYSAYELMRHTFTDPVDNIPYTNAGMSLFFAKEELPDGTFKLYIFGADVAKSLTVAAQAAGIYIDIPITFTS